MNLKEIKELVDFLIEKDVAEFELERGDEKVRIRRGPPPAAPVQQSPSPALFISSSPPAGMERSASGQPARAPEPPAEDAGVHTVKSPIVGTFFESPSPGSPPFVKPGDSVAGGQVLCIIEAMKLMNEIEADASGELVKVLVNNGQPVEYGQPLFLIRTR